MIRKVDEPLVLIVRINHWHRVNQLVPSFILLLISKILCMPFKKLPLGAFPYRAFLWITDVSQLPLVLSHLYDVPPRLDVHF